MVFERTAKLMGKLNGAIMATGPFGNRRTIAWKPLARCEMSNGTASDEGTSQYTTATT